MNILYFLPGREHNEYFHRSSVAFGGANTQVSGQQFVDSSGKIRLGLGWRDAATGVSFTPGMTTATLKHYIEFASDSGFPHRLITLFQVNGAMIYVDPVVKVQGNEDVFTKIDLCR